jgi:predicted ATPase/DNA-binding CsgD family transcriptional regulator
MVAHNLPGNPVPFIGRAEELSQVASLLRDRNCHLLTLVGPGGIGKTRLLLEAARQQQDAFPDGVFFVPLQPLASPDFIVPAIAEASNFQFYPGSEPKQQLLDYFRQKSLLLALDNFEHLLDSGELLAEILEEAPGVRMLVTSRERLNLREEWVLDVHGLHFPTSETEMELADYGAVQLFMHNAQRVHVGFVLEDAQKPALIRICQLVRGMPLGLELASAWVRALSCEEIATEIARSLDILATSARNVPPRHRNMRAAIDHSWGLLTNEEREVFKQLSVFRGGFRKEAALYVAGTSLPTLSALVDKSLLRVAANGRYDIHELLRQYGQEKLESLSVEHEQTLDLHSAFYADFMGQCEQDLKRSRQMEAVREIEAEVDNVREAWHRAVTRHKSVEIQKYMWSLLIFYDMQGWLLEGEETFGKATQIFELAVDEPDTSCVLGQLYARQAWLGIRLGYYEKAKSLLLTSLGILRPLDAQREVAFSLVLLGDVAIYLGEYTQAEASFREATAIYREEGDPFEQAWLLGNQAKLDRRLGNYTQARQSAQESVALHRSSGERAGLADSLIQLGQIMEELGNYQEARQLYQESLAIANDLPHPIEIGDSLFYLGRVAHMLQNDTEASHYFHHAMQTARDIGAFRLQLDVLLGMTEVLVGQVSQEHTVELLALIVEHPASHRETRERAQKILDELARELSPGVFQSSLEKGQATRLDQAIDLLYGTPLFSHLQGIASSVQTPPAHRARAASDLESNLLTERELEILQLMAQGMSNREIADRLILAVGTIKWYGSQICSKLQVRNRVQAVTRARELNILS